MLVGWLGETAPRRASNHNRQGLGRQKLITQQVCPRSDNSEIKVPECIIWHSVGLRLISASEVVVFLPPPSPHFPPPSSHRRRRPPPPPSFFNKNNYEEFKMPFFQDISALRSQQHIGGKECPLSLWLLAFI